MAEVKIGFATLNPSTGSGDATVQVTGENYKGRNQRSVSARVTAASLTKDVVINQQGLAEYVNIDATKAVAKEGGTITINGTTNSSKLTFSLDGENAIELVLPGTYIAAGSSTNNGEAIADDPGATGEVAFSITFADIASNETIEEKVSTVKVVAEGGQEASCVVTQAAGDPTLEVSPLTITLNAAGDAQELTINSNTNWSIAQVAQKIRNFLKS